MPARCLNEEPWYLCRSSLFSQLLLLQTVSAPWTNMSLKTKTRHSPSSSSSAEIALPMPVPPPVTIATLWLNKPDLKTLDAAILVCEPRWGAAQISMRSATLRPLLDTSMSCHLQECHYFLSGHKCCVKYSIINKSFNFDCNLAIWWLREFSQNQVLHFLLLWCYRQWHILSSVLCDVVSKNGREANPSNFFQ